MSGQDRADGYTDTEKKVAKRLKRLARDEGRGDDFKHMRCLALVRKYASQRGEGDARKSVEEFVSMIFVAEAVDG